MFNIIQGEVVTEKPKRKIIPCPQWNCSEGLQRQIGIPDNFLRCPVCLVWVDTHDDSVTELTLLGACRVLGHSVEKLKETVMRAFGL